MVTREDFRKGFTTTFALTLGGARERISSENTKVQKHEVFGFQNGVPPAGAKNERVCIVFVLPTLIVPGDLFFLNFGGRRPALQGYAFARVSEG